MALVSPGVEVTVIDESQYIPSAVNTVPYFVIATAQNKVSSDGVTVAAGTLAANANKTYLITSQRDLAATFGVPFFYKTTTGTPINGYELNEYGLLAAYSALGITNRCYVQRVDIDLTELTASLVRPTGSPANGDYWLDTSSSVWGIQEYNQATNTFTVENSIQQLDSSYCKLQLLLLIQQILVTQCQIQHRYSQLAALATMQLYVAKQMCTTQYITKTLPISGSKWAQTPGKHLGRQFKAQQHQQV